MEKLSSKMITLGQFLKLNGVIETGGTARHYLESHRVLVNGTEETRRGRKLFAGDLIEIGTEKMKVSFDEVDSIRLNNFRNYESCALSFTSGINVFVGANAQGKTNLIEALTYLSFGRSFRIQDEQYLIRRGHNGR